MIRTAIHIRRAIEKANHILLIPHQKPDGDALGALCAMREFLLGKEKGITIYCKTDYSEVFSYLPGITQLTNDVSLWEDQMFDLIIVFDSGDLSYAGVDTLIDAHTPYVPIINIDHHATNTNYGKLNYVDTTASSTCELIYRFLTSLGERITSRMATALLTGIITDTDNFTNGATTPHSLTAASHLVHLGADIQLIRERIFRNQSVESLRAWGAALSRLTRHTEHDIVYTYLSITDIETHGIEHHHVEGIANFMNALDEGRAACVLKQISEKEVKGSFRTTRDDVDVSLWAKRLGGGGHKKAAGFTIGAHSLEIALASVFDAIALDSGGKTSL